MDYPNRETYRVLYKRYLDEERVDQMISKALNLNCKSSVLDICSGGGRLARKIVRDINCKVLMVDKSEDMMDLKYNSKFCNYYVGTIKHFLHFRKLKFDAIFCQQAINYWFDRNVIEKISSCMFSGGYFIFNTFSDKPSTEPTTKEYQIDGLSYIETSWLVGNVVNHVQICEGYPPHYTKFKYISKNEFLSVLRMYFDVNVEKDGSTLIFTCIKK